MFQSHAGSIEAGPAPGLAAPGPGFQSHAGSIEASLSRYQKTEVIGGFNPTLVRLRPGADEVFVVTGFRFNPTLVRLRPAAHTRTDVWVESSFNPTLVRLRQMYAFPHPQAIFEFQSHAGSIEARPLQPAQDTA